MTAVLRVGRRRRLPWHTFLGTFFFFQAEDGIRDLIVTGVQTCALPISPAAYHVAGAATGTRRGASVAPRTPHGTNRRRSIASNQTGAGIDITFTMPPRSEERRVGKECRSRWSPYH